MDLSAIFAQFSTYIATQIHALDAVSYRLLIAVAVIYVIVAAGLEWWRGQPDPGAMIVQVALRIGFALLLFHGYDRFIVAPLYHGLLADVAYQIGDLDVLARIWDLTIKIAGFSEGNSLWRALSFTPMALVSGIAVIFGFVVYALIMGLIAALILTAGFYLVMGKLMIAALIIPKTEALFFGWLRGLLGAMFALCAFWFFMGALDGFHLIDELQGKLTRVEDAALVARLTLDYLIAVFTCLVLAFQARSIGQGMVG